MPGDSSTIWELWAAGGVISNIAATSFRALNAGWDIEMLSLEIGELGEAGFDLSLASAPSAVSLVFLLYQKGTDSRIFQTQDRAIEDFTLKASYLQES